MFRTHRSSAIAIAAALGLAAASPGAFAQKYPSNEIVIAPPVQNAGSYSRGGGANERVTGIVVVNAQDLDLRYEHDADLLRQRISDAARMACEQAEAQLTHTSMDARADCYNQAHRDAMSEARDMIRYARG